MMKICCLFSYPTADAAAKHMNFEVVEDYGGDGEGYSWDDGRRALIRCNKCGALFLRQKLTFLSMGYDSEEVRYIHLFQFANCEEALEYNAEHTAGLDWLDSFEGKKIWFNGSQWCW